MLDWLALNLSTVAPGAVAFASMAIAAGLWRRMRRDARTRAAVDIQLRASEQKFATLFRASPLPLFLTAEDTGRIIDANTAAEALSQQSADDLRDRTVFDFGIYGSAEERNRHLASIAPAGPGGVREVRLTTAEREELRLLAHTCRIAVDGQRFMLTAMTNITALTRLDERLVYAQSMEVVGRLSGGVAHEFNNLLTVMQGHLEALATEMPQAAPHLMPRIATLQRSVAEATKVTSGLLTFAGRSPVTPTMVDLDIALDDLGPVVGGLLGESIQLEWNHSRASATVMLGQPQIAQLVLNLALNARDAMPHGGRLEIATRRLDVPAGATAAPGPGAWVVLTMADSGHGMTDEVRRHMFEPFFTTKSPGQRTGLGLSICLGIAEQAGGCIVTDSSPGRGTTIDVFLPWAGMSMAALPAPPGRAEVPSAGFDLLVVEDDADVRDIVAEILQRAGYRVHALDGLPAVQALLARSPGHIHLLLTDLVLPGGSGLEVAALVRSHFPAVPVLFMSGYSEAVFSGGQPVEHLLAKPFSSRTLLTTIDTLLEPARASLAS